MFDLKACGFNFICLCLNPVPDNIAESHLSTAPTWKKNGAVLALPISSTQRPLKLKSTVECIDLGAENQNGDHKLLFFSSHFQFFWTAAVFRQRRTEVKHFLARGMTSAPFLWRGTILPFSESLSLPFGPWHFANPPRPSLHPKFFILLPATTKQFAEKPLTASPSLKATCRAFNCFYLDSSSLAPSEKGTLFAIQIPLLIKLEVHLRGKAGGLRRSWL